MINSAKLFLMEYLHTIHTTWREAAEQLKLFMASTPHFVSLQFSTIIYPVSFESMLTEIRPEHLF